MDWINDFSGAPVLNREVSLVGINSGSKIIN